MQYKYCHSRRWLIDKDGTMLHYWLTAQRLLSALSSLSACASLYNQSRTSTISPHPFLNNNCNWPPLIQPHTLHKPHQKLSFSDFSSSISACGCAWPTEPASSYLLSLCHQTLLLVSAAWYMNTTVSLWRPRRTPTRYQLDLGPRRALQASSVRASVMSDEEAIAKGISTQ